MRDLQQDLRAHRSAAGVLLLIWAVLWVLTIATWIYDAAGSSAGMQPVIFLAQVASPLVISALVGWWQDGAATGLKRGLAAGAIFAVANFVLLLLWSLALIALGRVDPGPETPSIWAGIFEALSFGVAYLILGFALGAVGGLLGAIASSVWRRLRGPQRPTDSPASS